MKRDERQNQFGKINSLFMFLRRKKKNTERNEQCLFETFLMAGCVSCFIESIADLRPYTFYMVPLLQLLLWN